MLAGKNILQLNEIMKILKENHRIMRDKDYPRESRVLAVESSERRRKKRGDQHGG